MAGLFLVLLFTGVLSVCAENDRPIIGEFTCCYNIIHSYVPFLQLTIVNGIISTVCLSVHSHS